MKPVQHLLFWIFLFANFGLSSSMQPHEIETSQTPSHSPVCPGDTAVVKTEIALQTECRNPVKDVVKILRFYAADGFYFLSSPGRLNQKTALKTCSILMISGIIYSYDEELLTRFQRNQQNAFFKNLMKPGDELEPIGLASTVNPIYIGGAITGYVFRINKLEEISIQLHEALFLGALLRKAVVYLTGRSRPYEDKGAAYFKLNHGTSFFSGHTTNAFELATIISHHANFWPVTTVSYTGAALVGLQRLQSNSHWPSDVFLGAIYGTVIARSILSLHEKRKIQTTLHLNQESVRFGMRINF